MLPCCEWIKKFEFDLFPTNTETGYVWVTRRCAACRVTFQANGLFCSFVGYSNNHYQLSLISYDKIYNRPFPRSFMSKIVGNSTTIWRGRQMGVNYWNMIWYSFSHKSNQLMKEFVKRNIWQIWLSYWLRILNQHQWPYSQGKGSCTNKSFDRSSLRVYWQWSSNIYL